MEASEEHIRWNGTNSVQRCRKVHLQLVSERERTTQLYGFAKTELAKPGRRGLLS